MRARKRNPYRGQGLDKRQARRARRRAAERAEQVVDFVAAAGFKLDPYQESFLRAVYGPGGPGRPRLDAAKAMTRPRDWAAPARSHLFGLSTLNVEELHSEIDRHAAYGRVAAIEAVRRELRARSAQ